MKKDNKKLELCFVLHADYNIIDSLSKTDNMQLYNGLFSHLYSCPQLPFTAAFSGGFLDWFQKKDSSFIEVISEILRRKQIEILSTPFYEPFISMIPSSDQIGQIEYMTDTLRKHFYKRPRGIYLPYSAWNSSVIPHLNRCGIEYCLLDKDFFVKSGLNPFSPVCMEDGGKILFGIPSTYEFENTELSPAAFYEKISGFAAASNAEAALAVFLSPKKIFEFLNNSKDKKSWFEELYDLTGRSDSRISLSHTGQILKSKVIYQKGFISSNCVFSGQSAGRSIKQLISSKADIYIMYAKMMYVHTLVNQVRGDKARKKNALIDIWKAENGMLFNLDKRYEQYDKELRDACYRNLLLAEKQTRIPGGFTDSLGVLDFDLDGIKEFISQRESLNIYIHSSGGKIFELDVFGAYKNYAAICSEKTGLFIDHLVSKEELERLGKVPFSSAVQQAVFCENLYQDVKLDRLKFKLLMKTDGKFGEFAQSVSLRKKYIFNEKGVQVQYILKNESSFNLCAYFMVEIDISACFAGPKKTAVSVYAGDVKYDSAEKKGSFNAVSWLQIDDSEGKVLFTVEANETPDLIILPIYANEAKEDTHKRGLRNLFYWKIDLNSGYETEKMLFFKADSKKPEKKSREKPALTT